MRTRGAWSPVWCDGTVVGRATGGGFSVVAGKSIAMAYVRPDFATEGRKLALKMFDALYPARVVADSPYDPQNLRSRA